MTAEEVSHCDRILSNCGCRLISEYSDDDSYGAKKKQLEVKKKWVTRMKVNKIINIPVYIKDRYFP